MSVQVKACVYEVIFADESSKGVMSSIDISLEEDIMAAFKMTRPVINKKMNKSKKFSNKSRNPLRAIFRMLRQRIAPPSTYSDTSEDKHPTIPPKKSSLVSSALRSILHLFHKESPVSTSSDHLVNDCNGDVEQRSRAESYTLIVDDIISVHDLEAISIDVGWVGSSKAIVTITFSSHKDVFVEWRRKALSHFISIQYLNDFI